MREHKIIIDKELRQEAYERRARALSSLRNELFRLRTLIAEIKEINNEKQAND